MWQKKKKSPPTYAEAHNKAVKLYQKTSFFLFWAGIVNVIAAIFGVFGLGTTTINDEVISYRYSMCFTSNKFIFDVLEQYSGLDNWITGIIIFAIALCSGALFALLGVLANQGKRNYLFIGAIVYVVDFALFFVYDALSWQNWQTFAFGIATHIVVLFFFAVAVFEYFNVLSIEAKHVMQMKNKVEETINGNE